MMKRILCLVLCLMMMPSALAEEENVGAWEIEAPLLDGYAELVMPDLRDGSDETFHATKRVKSLTLKAEIPAETPVRQVFLRLNVMPQRVTLRQLNEKKKWDNAVVMEHPGAECLLTSPVDVSGRVEIVLEFGASVACKVMEARLFTDGPLPANVRAWDTAAEADILLLADSAANIDMTAVAAWAAQGRSVQCVLLTAPEAPLALTDALWTAGVRRAPHVLNLPVPANDAEKTLTAAWPDQRLLPAVVHEIRTAKPMMALAQTSAERDAWLQAAFRRAVDGAKDYAFETEDAAACGLWVIPFAGEHAEDALIDWEPRSDKYLRAWCGRYEDMAQHGDPATIPYPADRLADGYLAEGEFLHEDAENGLWAYLSPTVQVEIVRYEQPDIQRVWFVTDLHFKPETESFRQILYTKASFKDQQTYPETLAQNANLILGVNGDYYPYRVDHGYPVGNILRSGEVLYDFKPGKNRAYPNLDTMALHDDGSLSVWGAKEITATQLKEMGGVHDALSFGPYLARDGALRIYAGASWDAKEPRNAVGMVSPGHYKLVTVEGRIPGGPMGVDLNMLAEMMFAQGVTDAFNLDGGSTSVLIFMGDKLNRTGANNGQGLGSPRNMHELFGVGSSGLCHTDMINGK
ncbi:MAG: phosphodiester glycosidase family protein [Clostridia bacterium]|nr:phosphodiester glycosidase family protein [Clostridia bacterium]